jgi:hypothetical protein
VDVFLSSDKTDPAEGIHITDIQEQIIHIEMGAQALHFTYKITPDGFEDLIKVMKDICSDPNWESIQESTYHEP